MSDHHHHHHDHGESCTCGCHDHDHHHDHDENCTCGCHDGEVTVSHHDGSLIGALSGSVSAAALSEGEKLLADAMKDLAAAVNEAGGIVGHIKFALTEQGRGVQLSVTDEEVSARPLNSATYRAEGVAIVFNISEDALITAMRNTLGRIITRSE